jgi:hypothetical protein
MLLALQVNLIHLTSLGMSTVMNSARVNYKRSSSQLLCAKRQFDEKIMGLTKQ